MSAAPPLPPTPSRPPSAADRDLRARLTDEFPAGAAAWPADLSRRRFLELMGASLALAGVSGCYRPPREKIVPYLETPESLVPGRPQFYATAMPWQGFARGLLVEAHEGRPTKIEGHPDHPDSLGATDAITQAAVLGLYDPDRSTTPLLHGQPATWSAFAAAWRDQISQLAPARGAGLAFVTEPTTSPTMLRLIHALLDAFPAARWYQHTALPRPDSDGLLPDFDAAAPDLILAVGHDFLAADPASLRHTRAFARRRQKPFNRLHVVEPTPTITGSMADARRAASPAACARLLADLAAALDSTTPPSDPFIAQLATDLRAAGPRALVLAGPDLPPAARAAAAALNRTLGATALRPRRSPRSDSDPRCAGDLARLVHDLATGSPRALFLLGVNPVHTAPAALDFATQLSIVPFTVHLGLHADETAARCAWHLPESHFLETWSDLRATDGTATIVQPLIERLHASRSIATVLDLLVNATDRDDDHAFVRATWHDPADADWEAWLRAGKIPGTASPASEYNQPAVSATPASAATPAGAAALTVLFRPAPHLLDGRFANNGWLQELPDTFTRLCWGNAALVSPALAARHHLSAGDHVALTCAGRTLEVPAWIQPGQAEDCVTLHFGYGRAAAGRVGDRIGFDAFRLLPAVAVSAAPLTGFAPTGRRTALHSTHDHFSMEGRDLARTVTPDAPATKPAEPLARLFPAWPEENYAWAMSIDLSTCIGCQACVVACQAENNTPVVGPDQVDRGREMHWIRVDRYYTGPAAAPRFLHQPVPCMQCENAPCELVCPVGATVHSSEGLNDMVYNRCIGTRYCSNNCPYKVRRFNFLDFRAPADSPLHLQDNPDVTVRARGVMEKCTYCVQRINAARIASVREHRRIREGEIRTACQQACPAEAIVFGDLLTADSAVRRHRADPRHYALLEELNTKPRTTYLARLVNAPATSGESVVKNST